MKFWKNYLPFLLLNVLVSAATILAVLWFWQHRATSPRPLATLPPAATPTLQAQKTQEMNVTGEPKPDSEGLLNIEGVFGAGDLNVEYILIRNQSDASINLNGWSISSDSGKSLELPKLILNKNGAVRLYSKHGTNSVIELYWNSDLALWKSGDEIFLIDASGQKQASWQVP